MIIELHTQIIPGIDGYVLSMINRLDLGYKIISVLRHSTPGSIDLRSYPVPRFLCEIE